MGPASGQHDKPPAGEHSSHWLEHKDNRRRMHFGRRASDREARRENALRDWFGDEFSVEEIAELRPPPKTLGELLPEVMGSVGMRDADLLTQVRERWEELVGADVARQTAPCALRRRVLIVEVGNATWRFILESQHRKRLGERLRAQFPDDISDIRFVPKGRFVSEL
jgi:hypothetical protein